MKLNYAARTMLSFFSFNIGWWLCAIGASNGYPWIAPAILPLFVGVHLYYSPVSKGEAVFLAVLAGLGFCIDTGLIQLGLFTVYPESEFAPIWLVAIWVLLGQTYESLLMMKRNKWLLVASGAFSGPLSYYCLEALGILLYRRPLWISLILHALFWGALTPALLKTREMILQWMGVSVQGQGPAAAQTEVGPVALHVVPSDPAHPPEAKSRPDKF
jgi:hypothetical protein